MEIHTTTSPDNLFLNFKPSSMEPTQDQQTQKNIPRIGEPAPHFNANSTQGTISFPEDYKGKWVILFSHPADFTPVCTSEFMTFASMEEEFNEANCKIIGLSIDSIYSHIAWIRNINKMIKYKEMKDVQINFPLIEDIDMKVSELYGMIMPGQSSTQTVRAVFIIDPHGIVRSLMYYPMCVGRNFDELLRIVIALKTCDEFKVKTPANWEPGNNVIIPPPNTCQLADDRMQNKEEEELDCQTWFFCTKPLEKHVIKERILR